MNWKRMVLYPVAGCLKACPICPQGWQTRPAKSPDFFLGLLEQAAGIPDWRFVLALAKSGTIFRAGHLVKCAQAAGHAYSLVMPFENLYSLDIGLLQNSREVILGFDEYQVPETQALLFYRTLDWARSRSIRLEVMVSLTEMMVEKILTSMLVERLLVSCQRVHLLVPKQKPDDFLARTRFVEVLDYLLAKLKRSNLLDRIELDPCLLPILMPEPVRLFPACAQQETFHVFPDGVIKICPSGPVLASVQSVEDFANFLGTKLDGRSLEYLQACYWRQTWNAQESKPVYALRR